LAMASSSCSASSLNALVTVVRIIGLHPKLGEPNATCCGVRGTHIPCYVESDGACVCVLRNRLMIAMATQGGPGVYSHGVCSHDV
jgi:hypothetical protein